MLRVVNPLRHVTYRRLAPWPPLEDFMDMSLPERIKFVRLNLTPRKRKKTGRVPYLTLDEFATAVGATDRHGPMAWEKGRTPRDYAERIAALTPYPPSAVGGEGVEELLRDILGRRLRALEGEVVWLRGWVARGFEALGVAPELQGEAPPSQDDGARRLVRR